MKKSRSALEVTGAGVEGSPNPVPPWWNETAVGYRKGTCIQEMVRVAAARTPEAVAVAFDGGEGRTAELTCRELELRASRMAEGLRAMGVGPDVLVGVHLERGLGLVTSLLAVLKAGGAYLALDPCLPPARLASMMEDSGTRIVVSGNGGAGLGLRFGGPRIVTPDGLRQEAQRSESSSAVEPPAARVGASDRNLACVLYTAGSTGQPNGVLTEHRSIMNRLFWMQDVFRLDARDRVLQTTPFGSGVSVWELFWPLTQGVRLVLAGPDGHPDPDHLAGVIDREGITTLHFVPSMLQLFLEQDGLRERCRTLRHVFASGEVLPYALTRRFYERMPPGVALHNLYGPTEAAIDVSYWTVPRADEGDPVVPIGRPVSNTRLYVLDPAGHQVGVGAEGELHIGGVQVARGYLNRPELTGQRFPPDPSALAPGGRLFRTGDRVRWRADGTLEYLGRLDRQVEVGGQRIEPREVEVEEALLGIEGVREAAVIAEDEGTPEARLPAFETTVERFLRSVPRHLSEPKGEPEDPNPPALFILAPPCSGTTLLQRMLAPHPSLFIASELHLLNFTDLGQRRRAPVTQDRGRLDGLVRAVMELTGGDAERARQVHEELAQRSLSTDIVYRMLQQWARGRMLVDGTPAYALDPAALRKGERDFDSPLFVHLVRHPWATVRSFVDRLAHQTLYLKAHDLTPRELGESVWSVSHRNIDGFLASIPEQRRFRLLFEDLVRRPRASISRLCGRLGIPYDSDLLAPNRGAARDMVDGVHPKATPIEDPTASRFSSIDPAVAERWRGVLLDDFLGEDTWALAKSLGYGPRPSSRPPERARLGGDQASGPVWSGWIPSSSGPHSSEDRTGRMSARRPTKKERPWP